MKNVSFVIPQEMQLQIRGTKQRKKGVADNV